MISVLGYFGAEVWSTLTVNTKIIRMLDIEVVPPPLFAFIKRATLYETTDSGSRIE